MASKNPLATQIIRDGCAKWPDLPSRTLARKLMQDNPGIWGTLATARSSVLYHRGRSVSGGRHGGRLVFCKNPIESKTPSVPHNPEFTLPPSYETTFEPHIVKTDKDIRVLVLSDIHIPYHNIAAINASLREGVRQGCKLVILNGDTLDFHRLSRFQKDPRSRTPKHEVEAANQLLDVVDEWFPKAAKIFKAGNHDERYDHYIGTFAPELFDVLKEHASLPKLLDLAGRGWEYVTDKRPIYLGNLTVLHGHEYPTPVLGPVNAARGLFLRTKESALVGHHHQTSEHTEPTVREKIITTWSTGCLCELHPMYARFNKWNHGAAIVSLAKDDSFRVHNWRIHGGRLLN